MTELQIWRALGYYLQHKDGCALRVPHRQGDCDCGLVAAVKRLAESAS